MTYGTDLYHFSIDFKETFQLNIHAREATSTRNHCMNNSYNKGSMGGL